MNGQVMSDASAREDWFFLFSKLGEAVNGGPGPPSTSSDEEYVQKKRRSRSKAVIVADLLERRICGR